jgi:dihydrofolate synthase/folylpolyglutamate synthase
MNSSGCRAYLEHLERFGVKLGLENITALLRGLGHPHQSFPSVHVAGTNGKGSVSAMLSRILREHRLLVGLYTSPHLVSAKERILIGGRRVGARQWCGQLSRIKRTAEDLMAAGRLERQPTYFEALTALAFLEFKDRGVDIAVLEVGMGGRFDATNVVTPLVSVITTIAKDHQKNLGRTLRSIAFEKAGIIKPGIPVVSGARKGPARAELERRARERGAPFYDAFGRGTEFEVRKAVRGYLFKYRSQTGIYEYTPGLEGKHQGSNAAVAIAAAEILERTWRPLEEERIIRGIERTEWKGRLEIVSENPQVILDGAHNEEGIASLVTYLKEIVRHPVILVFGVLKDKEIGSMARLLFPEAGTVILTRAPYRRSASPEDILRAAPSFRDKIRLEPDVKKAVRLAISESRGRIPIVIAGSLFLAGEVKRLRLFPGGRG